jgi:hypothetical protein
MIDGGHTRHMFKVVRILPAAQPHVIPTVFLERLLLDAFSYARFWPMKKSA